MTEALTLFNTQPAPQSLLILAEKGFMRRCADVEDYLIKLKAYLQESKGMDVCLYTPGGMYNLECEGVIPVLLETQNKTAFVYSLENSIDMFDECYIISQPHVSDPYLDGARETMTAHNKSITQLGYKLKV